MIKCQHKSRADTNRAYYEAKKGGPRKIGDITPHRAKPRPLASLTISPDAPAAITARTQQLAEALGLITAPCDEDGIVLVNAKASRFALVKFDGSILPGRLEFGSPA